MTTAERQLMRDTVSGNICHTPPPEQAKWRDSGDTRYRVRYPA